MRISLSPQTAQRIREALGNEVDLAPDLVPSVLARLAVEAPAVYSQVLAELSGSQIRLDSEAELLRRQRRSALKRVLFSWGEYETGVGDRLLAKRHIAAAAPLSMAALILAFLAISLALGHRPSAAPAQPAAVVSPPRAAPPPFVPAPREPGSSRSALAAMTPLLPSALPVLSPPIFAPHPGTPVVVGASSPVVYNRTADRDGAQVEAPSRPAPGASPQPSLAPGTRIPATLLTGAVVVAGGPPTPVVVETSTPSGIWMGQAALGPADRVQVTLTLVAQNRAEAVRGVALDPERLVPGVPGRTTVRRPSAAAALAAAAIGAAGDYAGAAAGQGVFFDWWGAGANGQAPPAWTYLAARLAREFEKIGRAHV